MLVHRRWFKGLWVPVDKVKLTRLSLSSLSPDVSLFTPPIQLALMSWVGGISLSVFMEEATLSTGLLRVF